MEWPTNALAAVIVAALAATGAFVYRTRSGNPAPEANGSNRRVMLAILPFENLGDDPEQAYLSDGLTEEMITIYYRARRYDDALRQMKQTLSMDPNYMLGYLNLGLIHAASGAYNEAVTAFQRATSYSPEFTDSLGLLGYAYAKAGRFADARAIGTELRRLSEGRYISGYIRAHYHLGLGEREQALTELERAYEERSWLVALLKVDPLCDELRSDSLR